MATASIIKFGVGNYTYIPVTATEAIQHSYNNGSYLLKSYLDNFGENIDKVSSDLSDLESAVTTLAEVTLNTYTKLSDYNASYVRTGETANQIEVNLPNGTYSTITVNDVAHATAADSASTATNLANKSVTFDESTGQISYQIGSDYSGNFTPTASTNAYGFVKVDDTPTAGSMNALSSNAASSLNTAISDKADANHTHTLNTISSADTTTKTNNLVDVVVGINSGITLGETAATLTYLTYTVPTQKYVTDYVDQQIADVSKALKYRGIIPEGSTTWPGNVVQGDTYIFGGECTISGEKYESGDMALYDGTNWNVVNANWTAEDADHDLTVGDSNYTTLAYVGGVEIKAKVAQEANVVHTSDLGSFVKEVESSGNGVVTSYSLTDVTDGKKVTLNHTDLSYTLNGTSLKTLTYLHQNENGVITNTTFTDIPTFVGTDGTDAGTAGLVPAPKTKDEGTVLASSGNWESLIVSSHNVTSYLNYATSNTTVDIDDSLFGTFSAPEAAITIADHTISVG